MKLTTVLYQFNLLKIDGAGETNMVFNSQISVSGYNQYNNMRYKEDRISIAPNILVEKL